MSAKKENTKEEKPEAEKKEGAEGAEGDAPKKKSKKKLIIIIAAAVLLLGGGGAGLVFSGVLGGDDKKSEGKKGEHGAEGEHAEGGEAVEYELDKEGKPVLDEHGKPVKAKPVFYAMPDIIVNLNSPSPYPHFVNLKMTLELKKAANTKDVEDNLPRIIDSFNTYLREVRREDLQGSAGTFRLKKELQARLDKILGEKVVSDILFREIIVQ